VYSLQQLAWYFNTAAAAIGCLTALTAVFFFLSVINFQGTSYGAMNSGLV
jgi:hypothetical protein